MNKITKYHYILSCVNKLNLHLELQDDTFILKALEVKVFSKEWVCIFKTHSINCLYGFIKALILCSENEHEINTSSFKIISKLKIPNINLTSN